MKGLSLALSVTLLVALSFGLVWANATKSTALDEQKAAYSQKSQTVIMRFAGKVEDKLALTIRPLTLGQKVPRETPNTLIFRLTNLSDAALQIRAAPQISPPLAAKNFKQLSASFAEMQTLAPRETRDMTVVYSLTNDLPAAIDTIYLTYAVFSAE